MINDRLCVKIKLIRKISITLMKCHLYMVEVTTLILIELTKFKCFNW